MNDFFSTLFGFLSGCYSDAWDTFLYDTYGYNILGWTFIGAAFVMALIFYFLPSVKFTGRKWWFITLGVTFFLTTLIGYIEGVAMYNGAGSDEVADCGYGDVFGSAIATGLLSAVFYIICSVLCLFSTHNYKVPYKN